MRPKSLSWITVCAGGLLLSFFIPWFGGLGASISGYEITKLGENGKLVLVVPILATITIVVGVFGQNNRLVGAACGLVPIAAVMYFSIRFLDQSRYIKVDHLIEIAGKVFDIGAYLTIMFSLLLLYFSIRGTRNMTPVNQIRAPFEEAQVHYMRPKRLELEHHLKDVEISLLISRISQSLNKSINYGQQALIRYRWPLSSICIIGILGYTGWFIWLKPNPIKDAEPFISRYCHCVDEYNRKAYAMRETFLNQFDTKGYKQRSQGRLEYANIEDITRHEYTVCVKENEANLIDLKNTNRDHEYNQRLTIAYQSNIAKCSINANEKELSDKRFNVLLESVVEERPDLQKVKSDLIGKSIPNWTFKSLSEFATFEQTNMYATDTRFESHIHVELNDFENRQPKADIIVVYQLYDGQWVFQDLLFTEVRYNLTAPVGQWYSWEIPKNTIYTFTSDKIYVQTRNSFRKVKCGPDQPNQTLPYSDRLNFASRENGKPAAITFVFKPKRS